MVLQVKLLDTLNDLVDGWRFLIIQFVILYGICSNVFAKLGYLLVFPRENFETEAVVISNATLRPLDFFKIELFLLSGSANEYQVLLDINFFVTKLEHFPTFAILVHDVRLDVIEVGGL